jgi:putative tryptophan/tyrosine transport system substrate-binding protein
MKRRDFVVGLGAVAAGSPLPHAIHAEQTGRVYRLGVLVASQRSASLVAAFLDELQRFGFVDGQNLRIEGRYSLQGDLSSEDVSAMRNLQPDVVFSTTDRWSRPLHDAIPDVPIIGLSPDLIASGLLKSLARPEGNVTGVSFFGGQLDGKRQQVLLEAVPGVRRIAILGDGNATSPEHVTALQEAARAGGVEPSVFYIRAAGDIMPVMDQIKASGAAAINVLASILAYANRGVLFERCTALRIPAMYEWPEMADEGGLLAYGTRLSGIFRQMARMVVKVFRGVKVAEIPVEQPTLFELVINLQTAKAIDLDIPAGLVLRADKLIE